MKKGDRFSALVKGTRRPRVGFLNQVQPSSDLTEMPRQPGLLVDVGLWYQLRSLEFLLHLLGK